MKINSEKTNANSDGQLSSQLGKRKRIRFIKNKRKIKRKHKRSKKDQSYDSKKNYYIEYWNMYYENEYILAKIKETAYELETMSEHLKEIQNLEKKSK